jgi:hypothetical protein
MVLAETVSAAARRGKAPRRLKLTQQDIEESPKLKRKLLLSILAVIPAAFLPLTATSQLIHERGATPAEKAEPAYKYEVSAGYGYTNLNQVNNSRNGLQGVDLSVTRDWGKFFGLIADGGYYQFTYDSKNPVPTGTNGTPTVESVLLGPVVHGNLYGRLDGSFRVLIGGVHTGGEEATPKVSFAGGVGAGMDYRLNKRFWLRVTGDDIASSFAANTNSGVCTGGNCSAHMRRNAHAALALVYKF